MAFWVLAAVFVASAAVSYIATRQAMKKAKEAADRVAGVLINKESNVEPIPVIYGERRVGGTRVFISTRDALYGDPNEYLYIALVLCEGEINSVSNIKLDDTPITDARFSGLVTYNVHLGTDDQTYDTLLAEADTNWGTNHRLRGVAYIAMRLKWSQEAFSGVPDITCVVQGRKVFDPRTSTTAYSNNPALCLYDYLTNTRYGKGLPSSAIDTASFQTAANDCDQSATFYSGGTSSKLFQCNYVLDTGSNIFDNVQKMLLSCRGFLPYTQGQYSLRIDKSASSLFTFDTDTIIGGINIKGETKEEKFNRVIVRFPNAQVDYQPDQAIWPDAGSQEETDYLAEDNGTLLVDTVEMETVTNYYIARDFARILLLRSRNAMRVGIKTSSEAIRYQVGDVVSIEHPTPGWTGASIKPFQIEEITLNYDGTCNLTLLEYDATVYPYDSSAQEVTYPDTNLPDPFTVGAPSNLVATGAAIDQNDGTYISGIDVSWDASTDSFVNNYELSWTPSGGSTTAIITGGTSYQITNLDASTTYDISLRAINSIGARSAAVTANGVSPAVDTTAPAAPTGISVAGGFQKIVLEWTNPADADFYYVEIKANSTNDEPSATSIGRTSGTQFIHDGFSGQITRYYWLRSVDRSTNASAWTAAGSGTSIYLATADFNNNIVPLTALDTSLQNTIAGKVDETDFTVTIADINNSVQDILDGTYVNQVDLEEVKEFGRQRDINSEQLAEVLLRTTLDADRQNSVIRDASITVNPDTGEVSIQALDNVYNELGSRIGTAEITLNAQQAEINLKATQTYVNDQIALAQLDEVTFEDYIGLEARISQAEVDIDAAESAILLKADLTTLTASGTGVYARLDTAEIDISALENSITLKVDQTEYDGLETRVGAAEVQLETLDAPSITLAVTDVRKLNKEIENFSELSLQDILNLYNTREALREDIAFARLSIAADVNDNREAIATQRLELLSLIDNNTASIVSEQQTRANADSALSSSITTLQASVGTNAASIVTEQNARADADSALTNTINLLDSRVEDAEADILTEASARADGDAAQAQVSQALLARFDASTADTYNGSTAYVVGDEVVQSGIVYRCILASTGNAPPNITYWETVDTLTSVINTESTARSTADSALASTQDALIVSLGATATDNYDNTKSYVAGDGVVQSGIGYIAKQATTGNAPPNATYWEPMTDVSASITNIEQAKIGYATLGGVPFDNNGTIVDKASMDVYNASNDPDAVWNIGLPLAQVVKTVQITDGTDTASIQTLMQARRTYDDDLEAEAIFKIDVNGRVSGFGLRSSATDASFNITADRFFLSPVPDYNQNSQPGSGTEGDVWYKADTGVFYIYESGAWVQSNPSSPFIIYTADQTVTKGGEDYTIPKGVYIQDAFIQNGSITTANIQDATITTAKIDDLTVTTGKIANLAVTEGKITDLAVDTIKIAGNAVNVIRSATSSSSFQLTSGTWTTIASLTFTPESVNGVAQPISLKGFFPWIFKNSGGTITDGNLEFRFRRGTTTLTSLQIGEFFFYVVLGSYTAVGNYYGTATPFYVDTSTTVASRTYTLEVKYTKGAGNGCRIDAGAVLEAVEVKR